jgi:hypothetical protein
MSATDPQDLQGIIDQIDNATLPSGSAQQQRAYDLVANLEARLATMS